MKLPVIKQVVKSSSPAQIEAAIEVLENTAEASSLKEPELEVIGELLSNFCGALEVHQLLNDGLTEREALNTFMQRVMGSIDR